MRFNDNIYDTSELEVQILHILFNNRNRLWRKDAIAKLPLEAFSSNILKDLYDKMRNYFDFLENTGKYTTNNICREILDFYDFCQMNDKNCSFDLKFVLGFFSEECRQPDCLDDLLKLIDELIECARKRQNAEQLKDIEESLHRIHLQLQHDK